MSKYILKLSVIGSWSLNWKGNVEVKGITGTYLETERRREKENGSLTKIQPIKLDGNEGKA